MAKILKALRKTSGNAARLTLEVLGEDLSVVRSAETEDAPLRTPPPDKLGISDQAANPSEAAFLGNGPPAVSPGQDAPESEGSDPDSRVDVFRSEARPALREVPESPAKPRISTDQAGQSHVMSDQHPDASASPQAPVADSSEGQPSQTGWGSPPATADLPAPRSIEVRLRPGAPHLPFDSGEAEDAAEEYRRVRTHIMQHPSGPRLILISSPGPGDGKSVTALNVSGALALNRDSSVLLVDMDLRRPTIASFLGVPETPGVSDVLTDSVTVENAVVRVDPFPNLYLLPAGGQRANPTELLSSPQWKILCARLRSLATYVILDGPPVDAVAEYKLLEEPVDGLILVMRTDVTARPCLQNALETLPRNKIIGGVINTYQPSFWNKKTHYYSQYPSKDS